MKELLALNKYLIKYKWRLISGAIFIILSNIFAILSPPIIRKTIDEVFLSIQNSSINSLSDKSNILSIVMYNGILLIIFAILQGIFMFFMRQTIIVMSRHIEYDLKDEIYTHYQKLDTAFYKNQRVGDLMNRISEDVSRVRQYIGPAIMYIINLVALTVMCLWMMISVSPSLTLYTIAPLPILAYTIWYVNKIVNKKSEKIQSQLSNITSKAQENYSGIRVIKSFNQEEEHINSFNNASEEYRKNNIALNLTEAIYNPSMNLFIGLSILIAILVGGKMVMNSELTGGNIAEFVIYITKLTFPISAIGFTANMITRANVSQGRINEFLKTSPSITNNDVNTKDEIKGKITLENVDFIYPNTGIQAIKNFNLTILPGEKICIIGKTGSGKSTISHLLLRMYDINSGNILIDDRPIKDYNLDHLRASISYVPQDIFLFSDTIANNIAFGNNGTIQSNVETAAKQAAIHDEILQFKDGYDTVIGERGVMLSGGQKQRISIARALAKKPAIMLLDESLSAIDTKTEKRIQNNLKEVLKDTTTIIITHRIFKDWNFDKIIIIDNGTIVESGTHEELVALGGRYDKLFTYQSESVTK